VKQFTHSLTIRTNGQGLYMFTAEIARWVSAQKLRLGLLTVFVQHTSASLTIQENADPDVVRDLQEFFRRLVRENESWYRHTAEGPDDMPAHIRAALTQTQLTIPLVNGELTLGIWQGVYLFEHRSSAHSRTVVLHLIGE
jgi:secondary thiamine-phosphate synthase enzyme